MGLDMYLLRTTSKKEEVGYWRKSNHIRQWFVNHTGYEEDADCQYHDVTKEQLEQLVADCKTVLADHSKAKELLPTSSGFLFGSTDYDEWYFDDLKATIEMVEKVIAETDWENQIIEYYEWW